MGEINNTNISHVFLSLSSLQYPLLLIPICIHISIYSLYMKKKNVPSFCSTSKTVTTKTNKHLLFSEFLTFSFFFIIMQKKTSLKIYIIIIVCYLFLYLYQMSKTKK